MWRLPLRTDAVATALAGSRWRPEVLASSPSTNAVVADRARAGESPGLLVVTDHQTAGRGRLDRTWVTPAGVALTFSMLVAPGDVPVARWPWLPLLAGVAVAHAVRRAAGVDARLKWPNDVLVDDAKTTGILVERVEGPRHASAVIGIGVNVLQTRDELPVDTATSLAVAAGRPVDRVALLAAIADELGRGYDDWCAAAGDAGASGLLATYTGLCATVGLQVRVELPRDEVLIGEATGIDEDGRLLVAGPSGAVALGAGDVVHVRRSLPPA
ncbi:biotin--[acetyl-CoA-carboxylase] ligase [Nocardioides iriomotensis]|uniref:biotin--[biotin carboxyl-carrier protein] ligase n=2 Tax=Nocardioides iriomotensis TaxID=715784 RepID=A0A4Q5J624_9ACTN|nr:biotin--[acetyl-CoA-carboxylase] ligase [Nocardioides iriomotensis]